MRTYRLSMESLGRQEERLDVRRLFFLSVEGHQTEKTYFRCMKKKLCELPNCNVDLHIIEHPNDGRVSIEEIYNLLDECRRLRKGEELIPREVLQDLNLSEEELESILQDECKKKVLLAQLRLYGINLDYRQYLKEASSDEDYFVIVLDRDSGTHLAEALKKLFERCQQEQVICCLTNPCFEFWLLLHLVEKEELLRPAELAHLKENCRVSNKHTYVSQRVSLEAGHAKRITFPKFKNFYWENLRKAMESAQAFATRNEELIEHVGTSLPELIRALDCLAAGV